MEVYRGTWTNFVSIWIFETVMSMIWLLSHFWLLLYLTAPWLMCCMAFNISVGHINALCIALQTFYSEFQSWVCCIIDHPDILCAAKFYHRPFLIGYCLITVDAYHSLIIICLFARYFHAALIRFMLLQNASPNRCVYCCRNDCSKSVATCRYSHSIIASYFLYVPFLYHWL